MMYDTLLQLPIFQGLSKSQLTTILDAIPFHFCKFSDGEVIQPSGQLCSHVVFVLSGSVQLDTPLLSGRVVVCQQFVAPDTMPFYYLFGAQTRTESQLTAVGATGVMLLSKEYFLNMLQTNRIMLINVLNMLSKHAQKQHLVLDHAVIEEADVKIASWMLHYSERSAIHTLFRAGEADWCSLFHIDEPTWWRCLAKLEGRGIIETSGDEVKLIDRYALRHYVTDKTADKD